MPTFDPPQYNEQISAESTGRAVDYQPYPFQQLISAGKPRTPLKPAVPTRRPPAVYPSYMSSNGYNRNGEVILLNEVYFGVNCIMFGVYLFLLF